MGDRLYVETTVAAPLEVLWGRTQDPGRHQRWDLRFGRIEYLPRRDGQPQHVRYATAGVAGTGTSTGERHRADGSATSSLRFGSEHPLSPIRRGAGFWSYTPVPGGTRFVTGYDYTPRGPFDAVVRPLMGWATAWSFDRLRIWAERDVRPERAMANAVGELAVRAAAVVLAARVRVGLGAFALAAALVVPPLPATPAARRCRRRPDREPRR